MKILVKICIISLALSGASLAYADSKIEYHLALKSAQKAFCVASTLKEAYPISNANASAPHGQRFSVIKYPRYKTNPVVPIKCTCLHSGARCSER